MHKYREWETLCMQCKHPRLLASKNFLSITAACSSIFCCRYSVSAAGEVSRMLWIYGEVSSLSCCPHLFQHCKIFAWGNNVVGRVPLIFDTIYLSDVAYWSNEESYIEEAAVSSVGHLAICTTHSTASFNETKIWVSLNVSY